MHPFSVSFRNQDTPSVVDGPLSESSQLPLLVTFERLAPAEVAALVQRTPSGTAPPPWPGRAHRRIVVPGRIQRGREPLLGPPL
eukprot:1182038-Prorocentrum_minimum.AAC.1